MAIKLAIFLAVSYFATTLIWSTLRNEVPGNTRAYVATFTDASGLRVGDDVRISGVKIGRVDSVKLVHQQAEVRFTVSAQQRVYVSAKAEIRYQNLVGQRYLSLKKGAGSAAALHDGGRIPVEQTSPALSLSALFNGFEPLFEVLNPSQINRLSDNLVNALQGSDAAMKSLLNETAGLTSHLAERDEVIGKVIVNLSSVLTHLSEKGDEFAELALRCRQLVEGLNANSHAILRPLDDIDRAARSINGVLTDIQPALRQNLTKFNEVSKIYLGAGPELEAVLKDLPRFLASGARITQYGSWANLYPCSLDLNVPPAPMGLIPNLTGTTRSEVCR